MPKHLETEIDQLKRSILALGAVVEENLELAVQAVRDRDEPLARKVINQDLSIDQDEVAVEEECLKILALHQPVATDLRYIIAVLKLNNDLERIGDLAVNVAERALFLSHCDAPSIPFDFEAMADCARNMVSKTLDALVNSDSELAREVCSDDDRVDAMNREMYVQVREAIKKQPDKIEALLHLLSVARHLERSADHATNIAEDVIYMIEGTIVRHRTEDLESQA